MIVPVQAPAQEPVNAPEPPPSLSLADEVALIRAARWALQQGDRKTARRALHRHKMLFPHGSLTEERQGLGLLLRCAEPSTPTTRALRDAFLKRAPDSVLAPQVRRKCAEQAEDEAPQ